MPTTVAEQFIIVGWWLVAAILLTCAWVCYLKLRKHYTRPWLLYVFDLLLVLVLFSYILAVKVFI